jgi:hypothetical protein
VSIKEIGTQDYTKRVPRFVRKKTATMRREDFLLAWTALPLSPASVHKYKL